MNNGIVYYAANGNKNDYAGDKINFTNELYHTIEYAKKTKLPVSVLTDHSTEWDASKFDHVIRINTAEIANKTGFGLKTHIFDATPYDNTLLLDSDAIIVDDDLNFGFEMCKLHGLCLCLDIQYFLPEYAACKSNLIELGASVYKYLLHYNCGVIFFSKNADTRRLFDTWKKLVCESPNLIPQTTMSFLITKEQINPFVLPYTWNYRPHYHKVFPHGPIKIWHSREVTPDDKSSAFFNSGNPKVCNKLFI